MSNTSIELEPVATPEVAANPEVRRPSTFTVSLSSEPDQDAHSIHSLERVDTVTSKSRTAVVIASVTLITAISTLLNGVTTVALPTVATDLGIKENLLLWYFDV